MFDSSYSDKLETFNLKNSLDKMEFDKIKNKENYKMLSSVIFETNFSEIEKTQDVEIADGDTAEVIKLKINSFFT